MAGTARFDWAYPPYLEGQCADDQRMVLDVATHDVHALIIGRAIIGLAALL